MVVVVVGVEPVRARELATTTVTVRLVVIINIIIIVGLPW